MAGPAWSGKEARRDASSRALSWRRSRPVLRRHRRHRRRIAGGRTHRTNGARGGACGCRSAAPAVALSRSRRARSRARAGAARHDAGRDGEERRAGRGRWRAPAGSTKRCRRARAVRAARMADAVGRWSARSAAIVAAIVIGDRAGLDDDVQRRLQEAGTYHVIAISGGNIAILAGLLLARFASPAGSAERRWCRRSRCCSPTRRLVGGGASVDRATLMAVVYFGARAVDQRSPPLNALALVAGDPRGGRSADRRPIRRFS